MIRKLIIVAVVAAGVAGCRGTGVAPNPPITNVVYNSFPTTLLNNVYSAGFDCCQTNELGDGITLQRAGTLSTASIALNIWACQAGNDSQGVPLSPQCSTTAGATFSQPITMNIYNTGSGTAPGSLIASDTQTFSIPYRPSADNTKCPGGQTVFGTYTFYNTYYSTADGACSTGLTDVVTFNSFSGNVTLPKQIIVTVTFNTTYQGYSPIGVSGSCVDQNSGSNNGSEPDCPYDLLNVVTSGNGSSIGSPTYSDGIYGAFALASDYQSLSNYYPSDDCVTPTEPGGGWGSAIALDNGPGTTCWYNYHPWIAVSLR
jgi:hypothetical protein